MNDVTAVGDEQDGIPERLHLYQNHPNPFNPTTTIRFDLPQDAHVTLRVYDALGKEVATLVDGFRNAGSHVVSLNAQGLASGVYLCRISAGGATEVRKMALMR
jgi:hypothetical protein